MCNYEKSRVLLSGPPGVGKTTLVQKVCEELSRRNIEVKGFYTEEVRTNGTRTGFDIVSLHDGDRAPLARPNVGSSPFTVGRYSVNVNSLDSVTIPILKRRMNNDTVVVIDEVGKMELCSQTFGSLVQDLFNKRPNNILATIPLTKGNQLPVVDSLKKRVDVRVITVTHINRDKLVKTIADSLSIFDKYE